MMTNNWLKHWSTLLFILGGTIFFLNACAEEEASSNPPYSEWLTLSRFENEVNRQTIEGRYPVEVQGREIDNVKEYRAVFAPFTNPFSYFVFTGLSETEFNTNDEILSAFGYELQHLDIIAFSNIKIFTAVWTTTNGLTDKKFNPATVSISISSETSSETSEGSTLETTDCSTIASDNNGILLEIDQNVCVIMESSDRATCRSSDGHANCKTLSAAEILCPGGTTVGSNPYLPTLAELQTIYQNRGSGTPLTNNGFCVDDTGDPCGIGGADKPPFYWTQDSGTPAIDFSTGNTVFTSIHTGSVRCIMRISL